jgi:ubiquinone/menaquinone biosynthesis C-methylase UbiE
MADSRSPESAALVYNALGQAYEAAFGHQPAASAALAHLLPLLPERARVLDVGAGTGWPVAATVAAAGHNVTGYDFSETMVSLARKRVPAARFELAEMRELAFGPGCQSPRIVETVLCHVGTDLRR